jgi:hypothetical protein
MRSTSLDERVGEDTEVKPFDVVPVALVIDGSAKSTSMGESVMTTGAAAFATKDMAPVTPVVNGASAAAPIAIPQEEAAPAGVAPVALVACWAGSAIDSFLVVDAWIIS